MGKSSSSQPKSPDPAKVAAGQTQSNIDTAIANSWLNNPNVVTPYGNVTTTQIGTQTVGGKKVPQFQQTQTLSPEQQKLYEQGVLGDTQLNQLGLDQLGRIKQAVSTPFDINAFGPTPVADEASRQRAYDSIIARNQPQADADRAALEQRLANQGIGVGSEAYSAALRDYNSGLNDFRLAAQGQAGNEMARDYSLANQSQQQAIANALLGREQPLKEFANFTGTANNFQAPNLGGFNGGTVAPTDIASPIYANYQARLAQQQQGQNATNSAIGAGAGLAGSVLGGWASTW